MSGCRAQFRPRGAGSILGLGFQHLVGLAVDALELVLSEIAVLQSRAQDPRSWRQTGWAQRVLHRRSTRGSPERGSSTEPTRTVAPTIAKLCAVDALDEQDRLFGRRQHRTGEQDVVDLIEETPAARPGEGHGQSRAVGWPPDDAAAGHHDDGPTHRCLPVSFLNRCSIRRFDLVRTIRSSHAFTGIRPRSARQRSQTRRPGGRCPRQ